MQHYEFSQENLPRFLQQQVENNDVVTLLEGLCYWLRNCRPDEVVAAIRLLKCTLKKNKKLGQEVTALLCQWLCGTRLYPLFISSGILPREGYRREMTKRIYERFNPAFKDMKDLRDVFYFLFSDKNDAKWINAVPLKLWAELLAVLRRYASEQDRERVYQHLHNEGLFAIEMLSIWVAAEDMEPDLMRLEPKLLDADSPFVALKREVSGWLYARHNHLEFDDSHLYVMLSQSKELIEHLNKRGATAGSSMNVAYLLERLQQTLDRLEVLLSIFVSNRYLPRRMLLLVGCFASASADQHSISRLWKQSVRLVSRSITQNAGDHGEHYITRNKKEWLSMFYSAAGGGILIALMALFKIHLGTVIEDKVWKGVAEGLNYAIGFTIIFMLHFTVATKQPAMTAARFAEFVERNPQGRALNMKLAQLLVDVFRSQSVAVLGNVGVAMSLAAIIAYVFQQQTGVPLLNQGQVDYQLHGVDLHGPTLWFAAIAGLWLFCSGVISGFFDNRSNYLNLRMRLRQNPLLKAFMPTRCREKFADYMHENYGSIMGNLCFGMLLGLTGVVGYLTGLPLDIRHVAFSSANVGYATISGDLSWQIWLQSLGFVLAIGLVNLIVSFSLTLWVALRSLNTEVDSWWNILKCVGQILKQRPLSLFLPFQLEQKEVK